MWTVLREICPAEPGDYWKVEASCDCGEVKVLDLVSVAKGKSTSCGCERGSGKRTHGMSHHPMYRQWIAMKRRCNGGHPAYVGVNFDDRWSSFQGFLDFPPGGEWFKGAHLSRIADQGDYTPTNARWQTAEANKREMLDRRVIRTSSGRPAREVALSNGIPVDTMLTRVCTLGWEIDRACTESAEVNRLLMADGRLGLDVARKNGIKESTFNMRVSSGWSVDRAATQATRRKTPSRIQLDH